MQEIGPFIVAAVGLAVAAFFSVRARTAASVLREVRQTAEGLQTQLEDLRAQREADAKQISRHASEVADLRKRLDKAKRRVARDGQRKGSSISASAAQATELELEAVRRSRDEAREEALGLSRELSRVRAEATPPPPVESPRLDDSELEALQQKLTAVEKDAASAREESSARKKSEARLKRKLATQETLYVSLRSELDAKKDRLRTQQEEIERLMALKAAVLDAPVLPPAEESGSAPDSETT